MPKLRFKPVRPLYPALMAAVLGFVLSTSGARAADAMSIQEFIEQQSKWPQMAKDNVELKIEGRYTSMSRTALRFANCELHFAAEEGEQLSRPRETSRHIEVTGRLNDETGMLVFIIERLRSLAPDRANFRTRKAILRRDEPAEWFRLGDWARGRAEFYGDDELAEQAKSAYRGGIAIERKTLPEKDAAGYFALAEKTKGYGLEESMVQELAHQGFRALWKSSREKGSPTAEQLAARVLKELPDSKKPLEKPEPHLREDYRKNPIDVYAKADADKRAVLHRIFYQTVALAMIEARAADDYRNGYEIAARIDERLPEFQELAEKYREGELKYRHANLATSTRQDVLTLVQHYRDRKEPKKARSALELWLETRTNHLRQEGPAGLLIAADDYTSLLGDRETAAALLIEAHQLSDESKEVATRLEALGYRYVEGSWRKQSELAGIPEDPIRKAMREGRITKGMTDEQVRKTVGAPTSISRIAFAGRVEEVWIFGETGSSRLIVHLERRGRPGTSATVVRISQTDGR